MKVLILKGDSPRHNYFAKKISEIDGVEYKIISPERLGQRRLKKMLLRSPSTFFSRVSKYTLQKIRNWKAKERTYFGDIKDLVETKTKSLNSNGAIELMRDFNPDLLVAFGIPIISTKVIDVPKYGAINLHGGISPEYKGGNTIFWPLYKKDLNKVGATLHYMVKKVDSGDVISKVYPDINPKDDEFTVSGKTFKYATDEMVEIVLHIKESNKPISGEKQTGKGSLYLAKDRTLFIDIKGPRVIKKNLKGVFVEKRIERFY